MLIYQKFGKRLLDISVSSIILILLSPLLIILFILIRLKLGKDCVFLQERPGKDGKLFTLYKFRSMKNIFDGSGMLLPDEKRLTKFGNFLRKTSLDELPEFVNVLKGEMSLVGPRPLLKEYLPLYTPEQARRHEIKPGITGWTQVRGRNALTWTEKFKLDVWYVDHVGFFLDLKILLLTLYVVFTHQGINAKDHVTMPKFTESRNLSHKIDESSA